jgi:hypothetical protein
MKKTIITLTLVITAIFSFSQTVPDDVKTKDYYLNRSRHQKTAAWIMLGSGVALTGVGLAVAAGETVDYAFGNSNSSNAGGVLAVVGIASALGSIPFFISASHNRRKAAGITFNMQKIPMLAGVANRTMIFEPVLTLKVSL